MTHCEKVAEKLSGYIDGELTQQQSQQVRLHIDNCDSCSKLQNELIEMQSDIKTLKAADCEEAALEKIMQDLGAQKSQQWGWMFIIIGSLLMMAYSFFQFIVSTEMHSFEKIIIGLLGVGGLLLFVSVLKQRLIAMKNDKYKDINL